MNKKLSALLLALAIGTAAQAQLHVGGTGAPGSTLQVDGSFAPQYKTVTSATTYTMAQTDYYVSYNNTSGAGTFTLPSSTAAMKGRLYVVRNLTPLHTTSAQSLTISTASGESIEGSASIPVPSGQTVELINTGLTGASQWEVVRYTFANANALQPAYAVLRLNTDQTVASYGVNVNWNTVESSNSSLITLGSNGFITLQPGATYLLEGTARCRNFSDKYGGYAILQFYAGSSYYGNQAVSLPTTFDNGGNGESAQPTAIAIITPTVPTNIALGVTSVSTGLSFSIQASTSALTIRQIN